MTARTLGGSPVVPGHTGMVRLQVLAYRQARKG